MPDWLASRFSLVGLVAVLLQQIPGIIWAIHPPKRPSADDSEQGVESGLEPG
jgi:hypothetical protein